MSWSKKQQRTSKLVNRDILSKTELALAAIKSYEERTNLMMERNKYKLIHPSQLIKEIDNDYSRLHYHKQVQPDRNTRLQLFPFNQQYFSIDMQLLLFPVRIFVKNVRNQGILYVGYDHQFPGIQRNPKSSREYESQEKCYDLKFNLCKDILIVLKNQALKKVNKIYLTFAAKKEIFMFCFKYDSIGYPGMSEQKETFYKIRRVNTEGNIHLQKYRNKEFQLPSARKQTSYQNFNNNENSNKVLKKSQSQNKDKFEFKEQNEIINNRVRTNSEANYFRINQTKVVDYRRENSNSLKELKKQKKNEVLLKTKANRQHLEQFKEKDKQIKETALQFKKLIEQYQKVYKIECVRNAKVTRLLCSLLAATIFTYKANKLFNKQTKSLSQAFKVRMYIKKFTKQIKQNNIENILKVPSFKIRNQMSSFHFLQLSSKSLHKNKVQDAGAVVFDSFTSLMHGLILNCVLNKSAKYRRSVRIIQRRWVLKYKARLSMLKNFADRHVEVMLKEYPHLRLGFQKYKNGLHNHVICYEYMTDESLKFRDIYDAYCKRIKQIEKFIETNNEIREYNKGKTEKKCRQYLDIPMMPTPPQQRMFRNLDILKSMLRGWFELEYKKVLKKNTMGKS